MSNLTSTRFHTPARINHSQRQESMRLQQQDAIRRHALESVSRTLEAPVHHLPLEEEGVDENDEIMGGVTPPVSFCGGSQHARSLLFTPVPRQPTPVPESAILINSFSFNSHASSRALNSSMSASASPKSPVFFSSPVSSFESRMSATPSPAAVSSFHVPIAFSSPQSPVYRASNKRKHVLSEIEQQHVQQDSTKYQKTALRRLGVAATQMSDD